MRRLALAAVVLGAAAPAGARVLLSQKDALALAFPDGKFERRTAYLTDAQAAAAEKAAGDMPLSKVWTYYAGASTATAGTTAYFESHKVRTMNEAFMVVVNPDATVRFVEILAFAEPGEYLAPERWLKQFQGRSLDDELYLRRGLRGIAGASITSDAVTRGVRRVLAVNGVLHPAAGEGAR